MEEQRDVTSVVDRVEAQLRHEIIYVRGYAAMYRERYLEYLRDLRKARWGRDYHRADQIIDDLRAFIEETRRLQHKERIAYGRLTDLVTEPGFTARTETDALPPEPRFARAHASEAPPYEN